MKKLPAKIVMALLRKSNVSIEKRDFEKLVKDLAKVAEANADPMIALTEYIKGHVIKNHIG